MSLVHCHIAHYKLVAFVLYVAVMLTTQHFW